MLVLAAVALLGLVVDPRVITGAPAWMKPLKFAVSIAIYGATLLWMLTFIPDRPRVVAAISWGVFLGLGIEMVLIVMQVLRNTTSHFNQATPFDAAVFTAMGAMIAGMWLLNAIVAFLLARRRFAEAPIVWGVSPGIDRRSARDGGCVPDDPAHSRARRAESRPRVRHRLSVRTRSALRTGDRACRWSAGARRVGICGWRTSSVCTGCSSATPRLGTGALRSSVAADARSLAPGRRRGGVLDRLDAAPHLAGAAGPIPGRA